MSIITDYSIACDLVTQNNVIRFAIDNNIEDEFDFKLNNSYYKNGELKKVNCKNADGTTSIFNYDKNNNLTKALKQDKDSDIISEYEAVYDIKNNTMSEESVYDYDLSDESYSYRYHKYDEQGRTIEDKEDEDGDGVFEYHQKYQYYENGDLKEDIFKTENATLITHYDKEGNAIKRECDIDNNGTFDETEVHKYNKNGNKIESKYINNNNKNETRTVKSYYDENGNLIKETHDKKSNNNWSFLKKFFTIDNSKKDKIITYEYSKNGSARKEEVEYGFIN